VGLQLVSRVVGHGGIGAHSWHSWDSLCNINTGGLCMSGILGSVSFLLQLPLCTCLSFYILSVLYRSLGTAANQSFWMAVWWVKVRILVVLDGTPSQRELKTPSGESPCLGGA
jgi:hypothetical protein